MSIHRLALEFDCDAQPHQSEYKARAGVAVKTYSTDDKIIKLISPMCATFEEFEYQVSKLKTELDKIVDMAYKKFNEIDVLSRS